MVPEGSQILCQAGSISGAFVGRLKIFKGLDKILEGFVLLSINRYYIIDYNSKLLLCLFISSPTGSKKSEALVVKLSQREMSFRVVCQMLPGNRKPLFF